MRDALYLGSRQEVMTEVGGPVNETASKTRVTKGNRAYQRESGKKTPRESGKPKVGQGFGRREQALKETIIAHTDLHTRYYEKQPKLTRIDKINYGIAI